MKQPLYIKIFNYYKNLIENGTLEPGDELPSESDLRKKFSCSRDTVRKATAMLEQKGHILKSRGKPSIVTENKQYLFPTSTIESFKELNEKNHLEGATKCLSLALVKKKDYPFLKDFSSKNVLELVRARKLDGEVVIHDIDYLDTNFVYGITKKIAEDSIYEYIEDELGLEIGFSEKIVTVENASQNLVEQMDIEENDLVVVVRSNTYLESGQLFQHSISYHKADKFNFTAYAARKKTRN